MGLADKYFGIIVRGKVEDMEIVVPFATAGDVQNYLEMLEWNYRKQNVSIDVDIIQNGEKIGEMKTPKKEDSVQ